ncbi:hypothetical protein R0381_002110 [Jeongeupia wiesaeckerbachi]|uniref:hypothetical protein n=1 Tax=Jeongeupia wiesaeckerbachi TaxID=3051218 RepID=UPI003D802364
MEIQTLWLLILGMATPVAGVVGFAIQLRQVKKTQLENEKLLLEIAALKSAREKSSQRVRIASSEEIDRFGKKRAQFSRGRQPNLDWASLEKPNKRSERLIATAILLFVFFVVGYAIYDLYRFVRWLAHVL